MSFFYLSFCDVTRPKGQHFLGATLVEANSAKGALATATALGVNPGGEVSMMELTIEREDQLPPEGRAMLNRFVPREEIMAAGGATSAELGIEPPASVCQTHNPRRLQ